MKGILVQSLVLGNILDLDITLAAQGEMVAVQNNVVSLYDKMHIQIGALATMRMGM